MKINEVVELALPSDNSTPLRWYLNNAKQLKEGGFILPLYLNNRNGSDDYYNNPGYPDWKGETKFKIEALKKGISTAYFSYRDNKGLIKNSYQVEITIK